MGFSSWDLISNMVRHYEVNRYLQTHYRPVVSVDGFLFLLRDDLPFDAATIRELDLNGLATFGNLDDVPTRCDWRVVLSDSRRTPLRTPRRPVRSTSSS